MPPWRRTAAGNDSTQASRMWMLFEGALLQGPHPAPYQRFEVDQPVTVVCIGSKACTLKLAAEDVERLGAWKYR